jgi:hypothetical protein
MRLEELILKALGRSPGLLEIIMAPSIGDLAFLLEEKP